MSCKNKKNCKNKNCKKKDNSKSCEKPGQNGQGDGARNLGPSFKLHYDQINWSGAKDMTKKKP